MAENAALPHGHGSDRVLGKHDFILIDGGGTLHGYHSDVTRVRRFLISSAVTHADLWNMQTFALTESSIPLRYQALWHTVHAAQQQAMRTATNGTVTAEVDRVARQFIKEAGYGEYFTHRLGHGQTGYLRVQYVSANSSVTGIGLEGHESPYLRGGSDDVILTGHTFSNEPGIYIEGKVRVEPVSMILLYLFFMLCKIGVRLEDCFYIEEDGRAVYLTEGVGGQASSPWSP